MHLKLDLPFPILIKVHVSPSYMEHPFSNYQIYYKFFWPIFMKVSTLSYVQPSIDVSYCVIDQKF